jgi:Mrp family chromosome partitioning ATPase
MVVTDAAVLSTLASSVLLITDADKTQSNHLKQAVDHFREVNANLIGIVLNRISIRNDGYYSSKWKYYDKSYGYGYHQGSITTNINGRNLANLVRKILKIK